MLLSSKTGVFGFLGSSKLARQLSSSQLSRLQGVEQKLTEKKLVLLLEVEKYEGETMTSASRVLSAELGLDQSTARRALQFFRKHHLVECGDNADKWTPLRVTKLGKLILAAVSRRLSRTGCQTVYEEEGGVTIGS